MSQTTQKTAPSHDVSFELMEFNHVRYIRGKPAAKVRVIEHGEPQGYLWMSPADLQANLKEYGPSDALTKALRAYGK